MTHSTPQQESIWNSRITTNKSFFIRILGLGIGLFLIIYQVNSQCSFGATGNTGPEEDYILVWADEFSADGAVCSQNWFHQTQLPDGGNWYNGELQHYTDEISNSSVSDGLLKITAIKEQYTDQNRTKSYTSARLNSKFAFTYGRVDARAKLPSGDGTWPAIWMLGQDILEPGGYWYPTHGTIPWPATGEIDIMEHWGNNPNVIHGSLHTTSSSGATQNTGKTTISGVSNEFHVYSMIWDRDKIEFLVDDVSYYIYQPDNKNAETWPFDKPQYLLLNIAMGGIGGAIDPSFTASSMDIDYIRIYQKGGADATFLLPSVAAVAPDVPAEDVISLFSDGYDDVEIDTWLASWSKGFVADVLTDGQAAKKYSDVHYVGIEAVSKPIDITSMSHLHLDFWALNSTQLKVKLVDFGANNIFGAGDDVEQELSFDDLDSGTWISFDIPIDDFDRLTTKKNIAQIVLTSAPEGTSDFIIDNLYFYNERNEIVLSGDIGDNEPSLFISNDLLYIRFLTQVNVMEYQMIDMLGRVVVSSHDSPIETDQLEIKLSQKGIQVLKVVTNQGLFVKTISW